MTKRMAKANICLALSNLLASGVFYIDQLEGESEADYKRHEEAMEELADEMFRRGRLADERNQ